MKPDCFSMPIATNPIIPSIPIKSILPPFVIYISPHIHIPPILSPPPRIPRLRIQCQKRISRRIRRVIQFQRVRRPCVFLFAAVARVAGGWMWRGGVEGWVCWGWMGEEGCCVLVGWGIEFEGLDEGIRTEVGFSEEEHSVHQYFMGRGGGYPR